MNENFPVEAGKDGAWLSLESALQALHPTPSDERIRVKISGKQLFSMYTKFIEIFYLKEEVYFVVRDSSRFFGARAFVHLYYYI